MKRWHDELNHVKRQQKVRRLSSYRDDTSGPDPWDQLGRYRKKHAMDCGKANCKICHSDKFPKRDLTIQELKSDDSFKNQLRDD